VNKPHDIEVPTDLLLQLRKLLPKRSLTNAQAMTVAEVQARRLRKLLGITRPDADLTWMLRTPNVVVKGLAAHEIRDIAKGDASGLTTRLKNGDYFIAINRNRNHWHRRFTLAHEIKHWLDFPYADTVYGKLGYGNTEVRDRQIERICDHFAAHFLMPANLLKNAWGNGLQDVTALAGIFNVSEEAMQIRLTNEGFIGNDMPTISLFRRVGLVAELSQECCNVA
jgi:Zn-dependent peptidase ImmA (M78 family)